MCCGSHEDYSAAYFPITTWPLQCNPILPLSCAPSVQSGLCVDLPSVEWIMMSSCELGPRPVYIHVASLCGFKHMRTILVYVASVNKFFYRFLKKNYYTTRTRCFKCYMHDYFHVFWLLCENYYAVVKLNSLVWKWKPNCLWVRAEDVHVWDPALGMCCGF